MKTILVLSPHPDFVETIRAALNADDHRVVHRMDVDEAEPLLVHGIISACILDVDLMGVQGVWVIERLRRRDHKCPIIAYTAATSSDWEEEAFLQGVTHVLMTPVRPKLLNSILDRLWAQPKQREAIPTRPLFTPPPPQPVRPMESPSFRIMEPLSSRMTSSSQTLDVLRDFSSILTHSLNSEAMLKQFLSFLREILSINRAAIFLNRPVAPMLAETATPEDNRRLRVAAAIGLSSGLLENFELSFDAGIGGQLVRLGRILRRDSDETRMDSESQKEFELMGAQVAVPIIDRESIVGVAVFDGRVTGESLVNGELELIFHLLGHVGLALRNIWLHEQLTGNNEMMADVLRELNSACIVVGRDLKVLHANKAARRHFGRKNRRTGGLEFSDLPQELGAKIYQVLKTGAAMGPYRYEPESSPGTAYNVSVVPFQRGESPVPVSALLTAEDITQSEHLKSLEVEAANLRLIKSMADRLAHEIGNAMVPLSTHQQLLAEKYNDKEFRKSLGEAMADGVKRVTRLLNQMRFLARDERPEAAAFSADALLEEAFQEARKHLPMEHPKWELDNTSGKPAIITGDRVSLKHALAEVMLNALQANVKEPKIRVRLQVLPDKLNPPKLQIDIEDNGDGFTSEAALKAPAPFFTTRNVGLGLGLTVSRKIIESHHGRLEILPPQPGLHGVVRVLLPAEATPHAV
jgi:nitrogen-specific signal transduction histidine kinase/DNA-binding NarL/FixJ family response regulator